jgi:hypothetical protein
MGRNTSRRRFDFLRPPNQGRSIGPKPPLTRTRPTRMAPHMKCLRLSLFVLTGFARAALR